MTSPYNDTNGTLYARYLNREIGDEEMLLDNIDFDRNGIFQAEYDITAGEEVNPLYEYPNTSTSSHFKSYIDHPNWVSTSGNNPYEYDLDNNGIFSRDDPFRIQLGATAELISENLPVDAGVDDPGNALVLTADTQWVCTAEYSVTAGYGKRIQNVKYRTSLEEKVGYALYPNPINRGNSFVLDGLAEGRYHCLLRDVQGRLIRESIIGIGDSELAIISVPKSVNPGIYVLSVKGAFINESFKISVL